jgi:hypothetical protein
MDALEIYPPTKIHSYAAVLCSCEINIVSPSDPVDDRVSIADLSAVIGRLDPRDLHTTPANGHLGEGCQPTAPLEPGREPATGRWTDELRGREGSFAPTPRPPQLA